VRQVPAAALVRGSLFLAVLSAAALGAQPVLTTAPTTPPSTTVQAGWSEAEIFQRAEELLSRDKPHEAAYLFQRYLAAHPGDARALQGLARAKSAATPAEARAGPAMGTPTSEGPPAAAGAAAPKVAAENPLRRAAAAPPAERLVADPPSLAGVRRHEAPASTAPPRPDIASSQAASGNSSPLPSRSEPTAVTQTVADAPTAAPPASVQNLTGFFLVALGATGLGALLWWSRSTRSRQRDCTVRGSLDRFPLPDVLQLLGMGAKEGVLTVDCGIASGVIHFSGGRIVRAFCDQETGEPAIRSLLGLKSGTFEFREHAATPGGGAETGLSVQQVLLKWASDEDEGNRSEGADLIDPATEEALNSRLPF